jgi:hypothetical protein
MIYHDVSIRFFDVTEAGYSHPRYWDWQELLGLIEGVDFEIQSIETKEYDES